MKFDPERMRDGEFVDVDFSQARFRNVNLHGTRVMEAFLLNARFSGMIDGLVINDVEVAPLIEAELNRRYPERAKLTPVTADGMRAAWSVIEDLWAQTRERASGFPEAALHERVDGEWSFVETLRHLVFVTDLWISDPVLGRVGHYHPFALPPTFMTDTERFGVDLTADPSAAEAIAAREDRMSVVRKLVSGVTDGELDRSCGEHQVQSCLRTVLNEEWHHNWYANRDLDTLARRHHPA